jgi:hypothetical protein
MPHLFGHTHSKRDRQSPALADRIERLGAENVLEVGGGAPPNLRSVAGGKSAPGQRAVAELAYSYWEQRGRPDGSALEDWLRAERDLQSR